LQAKHEDPLIEALQSYYADFTKRNLFLIPHYPCVIDLLPAKGKKVKINLSTLPGALNQAKNAKLSASFRIYPGGLAFLRLGMFILTPTWDIQNISDFFWRKEAKVEVEGLGPEMSLNTLTDTYAQELIDGLHGTGKGQIHLPSWINSYSYVDLVECGPLDWQQNKDNVFLPILYLGKVPNPPFTPVNLGQPGDSLWFGPECAVSYLPTGSDGNELMNFDRRKIRRWVRNSIELYCMQCLMSRNISSMSVSTMFDQLQNEKWMKSFENAFSPLPPTASTLFSYWNYTKLHLQGNPFLKRHWTDRHSELVRVLDEKNNIAASSKQAEDMLAQMRNEAICRKKSVGEKIGKFLDLLKSLAPGK
jgi:hypothetical protein